MAVPHRMAVGRFLGKIRQKVDRSAAYACRYLAKNVVAAGLGSKCTIQIAYAIGVAEPVSLYAEYAWHRHGGQCSGLSGRCGNP